jgi:hypothetical protein
MTGSRRPPLATPDARIARLAARQCGTFARAHALAVGFSDPSIRRRLRAGRWLRVHPGVYRLAGVPESWLADVWAALLAAAPHAVVSHETALRIHGSQHVPPYPIGLTIPHGGHARVRGAFVHQLSDVRPHHVGSFDELPVTTAARSIVDMAAAAGPRQLGRVVDDFVFDKVVTYESIGACLAEVARPGKPGVRKLARVLDERSDDRVPSGSELERALHAALLGAGLPAPRAQSPLPGRGAREGLVDAAYPDCRLILEADGRRWHTRVRDLARDHERDAEAARVGWQTLRFLHEQIIRNPDEVCSVVADVRAVRSAAGGPALRPVATGGPVMSRHTGGPVMSRHTGGPVMSRH